MKILYLAPDDACGERLDRALHGIAHDVTLATAETPDAALHWLQGNPDTGAVVVVANPQTSCSLIEQVLPGVVDQAFVRERSRRHELARTLSEVDASASARLAEVEARHAAALIREARICKGLQQSLFELEAQVRAAEERRTTDAGAFADQLARRHAEFTASLAQTVHARDALATELAEAAAALDAAQQGRRSDAASAVEHLRGREAEFHGALTEAGHLRDTLERALAEAEAAEREVRAQADAEVESARERYAALEEVLAHEADIRAALEHRLSVMQAGLEDAARRHAKGEARAAADLADAQERYEAAIVEHRVERLALQRQLAAAAIREVFLAEQLTSEAKSRAALEGDLAAIRADAARRARRLLNLASAHRRRTREQRTAFESQLTNARSEAAREREDKEGLQRILAASQHQIVSLQGALDAERQAHEHTRLTGAAELQRAAAEHGQLRQSFDRLQSAFQMLDEIAGEHATERTRLEGVVSARDSELHAQAQRHRAAEQAAEDAFTEAEERLRQSLTARQDDVARLEREALELRRELQGARTRIEALRHEADRVPALEAEVALQQKERRREFERAPFGVCRITPDGVITEANRPFAAMLGRRRIDDVQNVEFTAAVFDCAGDLGWLLERTRATRNTQSVETSWKTRDGRDLFVRLQASFTALGSVEIVAEDLTRVRSLEERLERAQRMEAVARLASEVAVTCDGLLGDVARGVRDWAEVSGSHDARRHGDRVLTEVTRASGFLRKLNVYGDQQSRALAPVSVQRVLGDLAPVLKRVVGNDVAVVLAKSSASLDVDVEAERLERVLVNVASYARERMPRGGQMRIDVAATALGRRFVSRYPHVRPGHHVLITVTELPRPSEPRGLALSEERPVERSGVDLGALVELVGSCGGHLWLEAQPAGNMVVKIYLPRRAAADLGDPETPAARASRTGRLSRWFRGTPAVRLRA